MRAANLFVKGGICVLNKNQRPWIKNVLNEASPWGGEGCSEAKNITWLVCSLGVHFY